MKITSTTPASIRPADAKPAAPAQKDVAAQAPKPTAARSDSVQISDAGRALADAGSTLSPERVAQIRQRVLSGAYHSAEMAGEVAKKMLESGDI